MKEIPGRIPVLIASLALTIGAVMAATTTILIPNVEFGAGVVGRPGCLETSIVDYGTLVNGTLSELSITGIGNDCAGEWIRISLYSSTDGTGSPIEQVVWQLPAPTEPPALSYSARANGTTIGTFGNVVWPSSEFGVSGLAQTNPVSVANINSFLLETSDSPLSDSF